jgi:3-keto-disaccharide hydrolase
MRAWSLFRSKSIVPIAITVAGLVGVAGLLAVPAIEYKSGKVWPEPKVVDPGAPGGPPSDAVVLFDGKDLSQWEGGDQWLVEDGVATVQKTPITSKQSFGDCQLHVEWAAPAEVKGSGQGRGNSGIFLQGLYEVQVLDSYDNPTYFDGQAGSIYKQRPPLVNACRKPGEWQTYDIIYQRPRFDSEGKVTQPGYVTVLHNGVLVQNHTEIEGATSWIAAPAYTAHADKLPIMLQNHGDPVRYRNIWIREL